jgi:hypothetical protein
MTKRKHKTLLQRQRELTVEVNELTAHGLRYHKAVYDKAMELEKHREPQRYVR